MEQDSPCPMSGKHKLVNDIAGELSCTKCGYCFPSQELADPIDRLERKEYDLGTKIGANTKESKKISPRLKFTDANFDQIFTKAKRLAEIYTERVSSQKIVEKRLLDLFKKSRKLLRGKNTETFVAACLHIACREYNIPSSPSLIAKATGVRKDQLSHASNQICYQQKIKLPADKAVNKVRYVASKLGLSETISRKAIKILGKIPSSRTGPSPTGIAAAILYLVCENTEYSVTHKLLAGVVFMNHQTIANSVKKLRGDLKKYKINL